jgi:hypothetical protein
VEGVESLMAKIFDKLDNLDFIRDRHNLIIDSNESTFTLPFFKTDEFLCIGECRVKYIKSIEHLIRTSKIYDTCIKKLKEIGLGRCVMLSGIQDTPEDLTGSLTEMHHGPIFTLYDYCDIIIEYFLCKDIPITTFSVADKVLQEHMEGNVQVVFLSGTAHELAHARSIFVNYKQGIGNLPNFLSKYAKYMRGYYKEKLDNYLEKSKKYNCNDFGLFQLNSFLK